MDAYIIGLDDFEARTLACLNRELFARLGLYISRDYFEEGRILSVNDEGQLYDLTAYQRG
jgi:hypothetical protein